MSDIYYQILARRIELLPAEKRIEFAITLREFVADKRKNRRLSDYELTSHNIHDKDLIEHLVTFDVDVAASWQDWQKHSPDGFNSRHERQAQHILALATGE